MRWLHLLEIYRKGRALANPAAWKAGAIAAELAAFLVALSAFAVAFGLVDAPISQEQALEIGLGISTLVGWLSTHVHLGSSKKVGIGRAPARVAARSPDPAQVLPPRDFAQASRRSRAAQPAPPPPVEYRPTRRHPGDDPGLDDFG